MNLSQHSKDGKLFDLDSLPPGYRFVPTDAEITVDYLRKKVDGQPLPPNKIKEDNLYKYGPADLKDFCKPSRNGQWFCFTPRDRKYPKGQRPNRSARGGYWKATGVDKEIKFEGRKVGYRKALVFYQIDEKKESRRHAVKTNWIMHEFRVAEPPQPRIGVDAMRLDDFVLCRVYRRDWKRPRDESGNDELSSSSKIPKLEADAMFSQDSLQVLPPAGTDVSFHGQNNLKVLPPAGTDVSFHGQNNLQVLPPAGTDVSFHGQNNLQVLPPAGTDVSFHGQNNLQVLPPAGTDVSFHGQNNLQVLPPAGADGLQVLPPAGTDVSFHGQNNHLMQAFTEFPFQHFYYSLEQQVEVLAMELQSSIIDNAALVSGMDLDRGYYQRANMGNTGLASTTDFDTYYLMGVDIDNANLVETTDLNSILDCGCFPPPADAE